MTKFQLDQATLINNKLTELRLQKEEWNRKLNVEQSLRCPSFNYLDSDEMPIHVNAAREAFNKSIDSKIEGLEQALSYI